MTTAVFSHQQILERFSRFVREGRLAHAYMFIGPQGVGKFETAVQVAKLFNCESGIQTKITMPCETCSSCQRIDGGNHPDVHILSCSAGETIKIEDIRDLIVQVQLRPFESQRKIFIIRNSENLTLEAGNALLKTLEEPSPLSLIILTTQIPERNLDTIRSRCQPVYFFPLSRLKLVDHLESNYHIGRETASFLSVYSEGCIGRAYRLHEKDFFRRKNEIIDQMIFSPADDGYLKKVAGEEEFVRDILTVLWSWFRDVILLKEGLPDTEVVHVDRLRELRKVASILSYEEINEILQQIIKVYQLLNENLNVKIALILLKEKIWVKSLK